MPALPPVPNVVQVATLTSDAVTRFFIQYAGSAPSAAQLLTYNTSIQTAWTTNIVPLYNASYHLTQIQSIDLTSPTSAVALSTMNVAGTRAGTQLPQELAAVTSYKVSRRFRGGHSRGYWLMGCGGDIGGSEQWTAGFVTAVNTGVAAFFTALFAAGWAGAGALTHVGVSRYHGFTVVTDPVTGRARNVPTVRATPLIDQVTGVVCQPFYGTQRRRTQFVG
jgi:hypothetical protein